VSEAYVREAEHEHPRRPEFRAVLERTAERYRSTAAILRGGGRNREAAQLEHYAWRAGVRLDEPAITRQMSARGRAMHEAPGFSALLERALEGALELTGADFGNVQVRHPASGRLRIACQSGFGAEFLDYFAVVDDSSSACGRAAAGCVQTVIGDVEVDPAFAPHREIAASAGFRAVHSTPLMDADGDVIGVLSVHFRRPRVMRHRELQLMQWYSELVGEAASSNGAAPRARRMLKVS
jgi:hypothetical protein